MNEDGPGERSQRCLISLLIEIEPDLDDWYNICLISGPFFFSDVSFFSTKEADFQQVNSFHNRTRMKKAWTDRAWQTTQLHKTKKTSGG